MNILLYRILTRLPLGDPKQAYFINKLKQQQVKSFIFVPPSKATKCWAYWKCPHPKCGSSISVNANKLNFIYPLSKIKSRKHLPKLKIIEAVIQKEYTAIHPRSNGGFRRKPSISSTTVPWKDYACRNRLDHVYPLYGQIDVQGSSESRNQAIRQTSSIRARN
jgi:hypothetical protein